MHKSLRKSKTLKPGLRISGPQLGVYILVFTVMGVVAVTLISAAGSFSSVETENGTLANGAAAVTSQGASGGKAVRFAAATTPTPIPTPAPLRTVNVATASQLTSALSGARPGDLIQLADGTYTGHFVATTSGTSSAPVTLTGGRSAILNGGSISTGYVLSLSGTSYWRVIGFTVRSGKKGIMLDNANHNLLSQLDVGTIGEEGIHLRTFSSDNTVSENVVHNTGQLTPDYGEGIYVGSAESNWGTYTGGNPDTSDRNQIIGNNIYATAAESIDIKEGTTGGVLRGNQFNGAGMSGANAADSWLDMKGNNYLIDSNTGVDALQDGFQTHVKVTVWGKNNTFTNNTATVNGPGYGFMVDKGVANGNIIRCNNKVAGAASGLSNITCTP